MKGIFLVSLVFIVGCAGPDLVKEDPSFPPVDSYPLKNTFSETSGSAKRYDIDLSGDLTLADALALALLHNPDLQSFALEVRVAEARTLQAGLWNNPQLNVMADDYDREGAGFDSSEQSVVISQRFEPGAQRKWRVRVAAMQGELAGLEYERKRIDVFTATTIHFIEVLAMERRLEMAATLLELSAKSLEAVEERVTAGEESAYQVIKGRAEYHLEQLEYEKVNVEMDLTRKRLASMWGGQNERVGVFRGDLDDILETLPALETLQLQWGGSPVFEWSEAELRIRSAEHALERAERIPSVDLSVGFKRFEQDGAHAFIFGVEVPLPLFNRNQGNLAASAHRLAQGEFRKQSIKTEIELMLQERYAQLMQAHQRVLVLRNQVVPSMRDLFETVYGGYCEGRLTLYEMMDVKRSFKASELALVEALVEYHTEKAIIEGAIGVEINELILSSTRSDQ